MREAGPEAAAESAAPSTAAQAGGPRPLPLTASRAALLPDGSDRALRLLVNDLVTLSARLQNIRDGFAELIGVSGLQYQILQAVGRLQDDRPVSVGALAGQLHVSGAYVTTEAGKLVRGGLLEKRVNPADRRGVLLTLSERGRTALAALEADQCRVNDTLFDCLSDERFGEFCGAAGDLVESAGRAATLIERILEDRAGPAPRTGRRAKEA